MSVRHDHCFRPLCAFIERSTTEPLAGEGRAHLCFLPWLCHVLCKWNPQLERSPRPRSSIKLQQELVSYLLLGKILLLWLISISKEINEHVIHPMITGWAARELLASRPFTWAQVTEFFPSNSADCPMTGLNTFPSTTMANLLKDHSKQWGKGNVYYLIGEGKVRFVPLKSTGILAKMFYSLIM